MELSRRTKAVAGKARNFSAYTGNLDSTAFAAIFAVCGALYLAIYALESPVRYGLYLLGKDSLILLRDGLIIAPLAALFAAQAWRLKIHPVIAAFVVLITFHGLILVGTMGNLAGAAYGAKIMINLLFGYFAAALLLAPGNTMFKIILAIWCITIIGVCLDKFLVTFPWVGIKTIVGDLTVDVSKDWEIQDTLARRVAGFSRSSISVAMLSPVLAMVLMGRIRHGLLRALVAVISLAAIFLTTQKGALIAFAPVAVIMTLRPKRELLLLRIVCIGFAILAAALPLVVTGLHINHGTGVFSTESLYLRIADTWPRAWQWISHNQLMVFGVGLGGIGGPQRIYAPDSFNAADNLFIWLYAYFGVFALLYVAVMLWLALRPVTGSERRAATAVAMLAFIFGYGAVLSMLEDQVAALFLGAALGVLWRETRRPRVIAFADAAMRVMPRPQQARAASF
jgi:hypothetical protein